ncbi:MAG: hypothetical protein Q8P76_00650 [bacterium]|nr:hypothetical protein [bacterium]
MKTKIKFCPDCGPLPVNHFHNWTSDLIHFVLESTVGKIVPASLNYFLDQRLQRAMVWFGVLRPTKNMDPEKISLRTAVFLKEAEKAGIECENLLSRFGPTNYFRLKINNCFHYFEGLPRAEQRETRVSKIIDDKAEVKNILQAEGLPAVNGRAFSWRQKKQAIRWASANLNFPLAVKPRFGSMSQHITMNIQDAPALKSAIDAAIRYSPFFIVENFLADAQTHRATVIDFNLAGCVKRVPAHVAGDGRHTIKELVEIKNQDLRRGNPRAKDTTLYKLVLNETAEQLLKSQNLSWDAVLPKDKTAFLQEKVILDLGGDLHEESDRVHPDNQELFCRVARIFNTRLAGVDFLAKDIGVSWKAQPCAIMELNSLPYIDMHHFPAVGAPVNPAAAVCRLVKKYY